MATRIGRRVSHRATHHIARVSQFATFPLVWLISRIAIPTTIHGHEKLSRIKGPAVLIANHIAFYDSFLIRLAASWNSLPIRIMGGTDFDYAHLRIMKYLGIVHTLYMLFGVCIVVPGRGLAKNTEKMKEILSHGGIVLIFPEGYINRRDTLLPFKPGAAAIALASNAPIIPIHFMQKNGTTRLTIGEPFRLSARSIAEATKYFEKRMRDLAEKTRVGMRT